MSLGGLDKKLLLLARTRAHPRWAERAIGNYSRTGEHAACWLGLPPLAVAGAWPR